MRNILIPFIDTINKIIGLLLGLLLLFMVLLILIQVGVRFILPFFNQSLSIPWAEETARFILIWLIFLGGAIAARHGLLIAMTALVDATPKKLSFLIKNTSGLILIITFLLMAWHGWRWAEFGADETAPALMVSKFWLYLAMPVGCTLAAINTSLLLFQRDEEHYK